MAAFLLVVFSTVTAIILVAWFGSGSGQVTPAAMPEPGQKTHTNSIGMEFVLIPAGSFTMRADENFRPAGPRETPRHKVTISKPFYFGKYEVTQEQWLAVMGGTPSRFGSGPHNPVEFVSWGDVQEFIWLLNRKEGHTRYRLPTEAEWEYAARAGTDTLYFFMKDPETWDEAAWDEAAARLVEYAWFRENSGGKTHPVGEKKPNPWGLYDVYGNVWELVQDWYTETFPADRERTDPRGPSSGLLRVGRGGSLSNLAEFCRSGYRLSGRPDDGRNSHGFRLVLSPK
jgi:formylglycine-generating enzyme required for sulfatase activity